MLKKRIQKKKIRTIITILKIKKISLQIKIIILLIKIIIQKLIKNKEICQT